MKDEQTVLQRAGAGERPRTLRAFGRVGALQGSSPVIDYESAFEGLLKLLELPELDRQLRADPCICGEVEAALSAALHTAYSGAGTDAAHLFLQRVLYRVNRLKLFWYDELERYDNERSDYLRALRDRIEDPWQRAEILKHDVDALRRLDVSAALRERAAADLDPPVSANGRFFRNEAGEGAYRKLLEIASLDGLVEASQLSRTLGGVSNDVHAMLTRLLLEEYGCGRLARKHSSYFSVMLTELGMNTAPEAYFDAVPWQVLAAINHSFLLSERKRYFLRYIGGLLYTEISVPSAFSSYRACAARLGFSDAAMAYWDLHIKEDERHGRWMLNDIALPLARQYPTHAWELVLGYDQQRLFSERAGAAIAAAAREADRAVAANRVAGTLA
jgi:hypothetical protein